MIRYSVRIKDHAAHLFEVQINLNAPVGVPLVFDFAAWIPGSYLIREFARHIVGPIVCLDGTRKRPLEQLDKHSWTITPKQAALQLRYTVYAWDFSVRAAHLDGTHGFFNGTSLFLRVPSQLTAPITLQIVKPIFDWKVATTLRAIKVDRAGFGLYEAASFDELIDHPVEMSQFKELKFSAHAVAHRAVFTGVAQFDQNRLTQDLERICAAQIQFFEPRSKKAPFDQYLFMTQVSADSYGGLEHRSSTALHCARNDLPHRAMMGTTPGYRQFLGLCSHEYFHSWNVKRIKPQVFSPYDLGRENHTHLLWIFEGFTSYYDDILLLRAGCITLTDYFDLLAKTISRVLSEPGRFQQSVAQASFNAWTKYYRQDENSSNSQISYYTKGSLVALCLDLTIRQQTKGRKSLDDVMRLMWQRAKQGIYLGESDFPQWLQDATGCDLRTEINRWAYQTQELPVKQLLEGAGIQWQEINDTLPSVGAKLVQRGSDFIAASVAVGGPAGKAGLSAQDVIIAADDLRMSEASFKQWLARKKAGDLIKLTVFRRDELLSLQLKLGAPQISSIKLSQTKPSALRRDLARA
jgi:predicted metalloprotease with PDZ domain